MDQETRCRQDSCDFDLDLDSELVMVAEMKKITSFFIGVDVTPHWKEKDGFLFSYALGELPKALYY